MKQCNDFPRAETHKDVARKKYNYTIPPGSSVNGIDKIINPSTVKVIH